MNRPRGGTVAKRVSIAQGTAGLSFYRDSKEPIASITRHSVPAMATVWLSVQGHTTVSRGDVLDPSWRRGLATDLRLAYGLPKSARAGLIRLLTDIATEWAVHINEGSPLQWLPEQPQERRNSAMESDQ